MQAIRTWCKLVPKAIAFGLASDETAGTTILNEVKKWQAEKGKWPRAVEKKP